MIACFVHHVCTPFSFVCTPLYTTRQPVLEAELSPPLYSLTWSFASLLLTFHLTPGQLDTLVVSTGPC